MKIKRTDDKPIVIHRKKKTELHIVDRNKTVTKENSIKKPEKDKKLNAGNQVNRAKKVSKSLKKRKFMAVKRTDRNDNFSNICKNPLPETNDTGDTKGQANIRQTDTGILLNDTEKSVKTKTHHVSIMEDETKETDINDINAGRYLQNNSAMGSNPCSFHAGLNRYKSNMHKNRVSRLYFSNSGSQISSQRAESMATIVHKKKSTVMTDTEYAQRKYSRKAGNKAGRYEKNPANTENKNNSDSYTRKRMISFFLDKMKSEDEQSDNAVKLVKDMAVGKIMVKAKTAVTMALAGLLLMLLLLSVIIVPVTAVVVAIYNSPFAIFFPPLEAAVTFIILIFRHSFYNCLIVIL